MLNCASLHMVPYAITHLPFLPALFALFLRWCNYYTSLKSAHGSDSNHTWGGAVVAATKLFRGAGFFRANPLRLRPTWHANAIPLPRRRNLPAAAAASLVCTLSPVINTPPRKLRVIHHGRMCGGGGEATGSFIKGKHYRGPYGFNPANVYNLQPRYCPNHCFLASHKQNPSL